jgi:amino acid efflux transporter
MAQELQRTISIPQGIALYMGAVVGAGILLLPGLAASQAGPASLISWAFLCVMAVPLAFTFAKLASRTPDAGGVLTYVTDAFGSVAGMIMGWYYWIAAATAQGFVALTGAFHVAPHGGLGRHATFGIAAAILLSATAINLLGLKIGGRLQLLFVGTVVTLLLVTVFTAMPRFDLANFSPFIPEGVGAIGSVSVVIFITFVGWEAISHLSQEFRDPQRAIMRSTVISVTAIIVLFLSVATATIGTATYGDRTVNDTSIGQMLSDSFGRSAEIVVAVIVLFIALGTTNAFVAATSRLGYALSRDGMFPRPLSRLNTRQVPDVAITVVGGWALLTLTINHVTGSGIETLIVLPNSLVLIVYLVTTVAAIRLLTGRQRLLPLIGAAMVATLIPFAGIALAVPAAVAALALTYWYRYCRVSERSVASGA